MKLLNKKFLKLKIKYVITVFKMIKKKKNLLIHLKYKNQIIIYYKIIKKKQKVNKKTFLCI